MLVGCHTSNVMAINTLSENQIISYSFTGEIKVWNLKNKNCIQTIRDCNHNCACCSHKNFLVLSNKTIVVCELPLSGHNRRYYVVLFHEAH